MFTCYHLLLKQSPSRAFPRTHLGERDNTPQTTSLSHPGKARPLTSRVRATARPLARRLHRSPFGLRFRSLREMHFEHTVLIGGSDLFRIHGSTEQKAPAERPGHPLAVVIPTMPILGVFKGALAFKRQHIVLDRNVKIVFLHPGEIRHENECFLVLQQVHPRRPRGLTDAGRLCAPCEGLKELVHLVSERLNAFKGAPRLLERPPRQGGIPSRHCHSTSPSSASLLSWGRQRCQCPPHHHVLRRMVMGGHALVVFADTFFRVAYPKI